MSRIVVVTDTWTPQVNGVVTTLVELVRALRSGGHAVTVIEPSAFRRVQVPRWPGLELAWRPGAALARRLDADDFDSVHIATEGPLGWAAREHCKRRGWAFTTAFHTRYPELLAARWGLPVAWGYALLRRFHAPAARVMVPSRGMFEILRGHRFAKLALWSHGVDTELLRPVAPAPIDLPRPLFLYVGRVSHEKNVEAFLRAGLPGSKLVCGVGPLREPLQRAYPHVAWRGLMARDQLPALYSAADVLVFPCRHETFGLVMLEALACGTPVAAFDEAAPREVLGAAVGRAGLLDDDLARAAVRALDLPRRAARERAMAFGWAAVAEQFARHLVSRHP